MNAMIITTASAVSTLTAGAGPAAAITTAIAAVAVMAVPVLAATLVLAWHAARGSDPGPAAKHLITLVRILWTPPRRRR